MRRYFEGMDLAAFWEDSDYARKNYVEAAPDETLIRGIEAQLGYKLPASYIALMMSQNGGIPVNSCFPCNEQTSWAEDHVALSGLMGIGREKLYSLCGDLGSQFMIEQWEYPEIGIYFATCPSAGHDMLCLDYRDCGKDGEPRVVHVDQEDDFKITFLADNFEAFVRGLVHERCFDDSWRE